MTNNNKVKIHIDGNYTFGIWDYLHKIGKSLIWEALFLYILHFISEKESGVTPVLDRFISYCFMGKASWVDESREKFLGELVKVGIGIKQKPLKKVGERIAEGKEGYKEDGLDCLNIAHAVYDAFVGTGEGETPAVRYRYLVMMAGDSDLAAPFDLLHAIGVKIIVVYLDIDKIHPATSELIIKNADYTISLTSLMYDRGNPFAQAIFESIPASYRKKDSFDIVKPEVSACKQQSQKHGTIKFIDLPTKKWGVIEGDNGLDYHFDANAVATYIPLSSGLPVIFSVSKEASLYDGSRPRSETNGNAINVTVLQKPPQVSSVSTMQASESTLKEIVSSCRVFSNGYALLAEVGAVYAFKFGKPARPLKEILGDYPNTFEFTYTPAAGVRVKS